MKTTFPWGRNTEFPKKKITIIVPTGPGGEDAEARGIAPYVRKHLDVNVVIEPQVGLWGKTAFEKFKETEPDGHTLITYTFPRSIIIESLCKAEFKTKEFTPVFAWSLGSPLLVVAADTYGSFDEFLRAARTKRLSGSVSVRGGTCHLAGLLLAQGLGIDVHWGPHEGSASSIATLTRREVDFNICVPSALPSWIRSGKIKLLAILSDKRDPFFPDIPCLKELGYDMVFIQIRHGVEAPPGTPALVVQVLEEAFSEAVKEPGYIEWAKENRVVIDPLRSLEFGRVVEETYPKVEKFKEILRASRP